MNKFMSRLVAATGLLSSLLPAILPSAYAADPYPMKPIKIVVPFTPGGTTDILARLIGQKLGEAFGQPVIIDNRAGAGGTIGADSVAKSPHDGYTLLMGTVGTQASNQSLYAKMPYNSSKDFAPITLVTNGPNVLLVNSTLAVKSVAELIALARAQPGHLNYASTSTGGSPHLSGELFNSMANVKIMHIAYKGAAPAMTDLIAGQVNMMYDNLPSALAQIKSGKVRALAETSRVRAPVLPDVPTVAESGLPGYEVNSWFGLLAPAGTSPEIVNRLQAEVRKIIAQPEINARIVQLGAIPAGSTPAEFADTIKADTDKWAKVIREANIKVE